MMIQSPHPWACDIAPGPRRGVVTYSAWGLTVAWLMHRNREGTTIAWCN